MNNLTADLLYMPMFYYRYRNLTCLFSLSMNAVFVPSLAQFFLHTINLWFRVKKKTNLYIRLFLYFIAAQ